MGATKRSSRYNIGTDSTNFLVPPSRMMKYQTKHKSININSTAKLPSRSKSCLLPFRSKLNTWDPQKSEPWALRVVFADSSEAFVFELLSFWLFGKAIVVLQPLWLKSPRNPVRGDSRYLISILHINRWERRSARFCVREPVLDKFCSLDFKMMQFQLVILQFLEVPDNLWGRASRGSEHRMETRG